jgi:hypothetical protein
MLSDFMQVLNSTREFYTKTHYFSQQKIIFYNLFTMETEIKS